MKIREMTQEQIQAELKRLEEKNKKYEPYKNWPEEDRLIYFKYVVNLLDKQPQVDKYSTGISQIDNTTDGFEAGELVLITGPSGEGKTTLTQTIARNIYESTKKPPIFLSYEVTYRGLANRFRRYNNELPNFVVPMTMNKTDKKLTEIEWVELKIKEGIANFGSRVVIIDHLHYLARMGSLAEAKNTSFAIGEIMRELKRMAVEHDVLVFLVAHTKKVEPGQEVSTADIRDSSFCIQESDAILLIWRTLDSFGAYENKNYIKIGKNRRLGVTGIGLLKFNRGFFEDGDTSPQELRRESFKDGLYPER